MKKIVFHQCPRCDSKVTEKFSYPLFFFVAGLIFCMPIITMIIGYPMLILSVLWFIAERFTSKRFYRCKTCKYVFQIDTKEEARD